MKERSAEDLAWYRARNRPEGASSDGEATPVEGSRRQVTVVFCDLVDSTGILDPLDPELVHEILVAYHRCTARVVERYEGWVGKFMGDGVLACFGYPRAHEDDARRAVLAGLELVEDVKALSETVRRTHSIELTVRVGMHTGVVVVAEMGGGRRREPHDLAGAPTNLASRIQSVAEPGTVVISSSTYDLVRGYFLVEEIDRQQLRGLPEPVPLYRVLAPSGAENRLQAVEHRARLIGREKERQVLTEAWRRARDDRAESILVEGEAGIGKSRLIEALVDEVSGEGEHAVLQCSPHHLNTPLYPFARFLRRQVGGEEGDQWERLRSWVEKEGPTPTEDVNLLATLAGIPTPTDAPPSVITAERRREQLFQAIMAWLDRITSARPLLVVVEDLHWADPTSLELLTRLVTRSAARRALFVLSTRSGHGLPVDVETVTLGPLEPDDCSSLVAAVAGERSLTAELQALVVRRSDGVPLFIEELTRMLVASGPDARTWPATETQEIPPTLRELLSARLDQLPSEKRLAQVAATVGQAAPIALLQHLMTMDEPTLRAALAPLIKAGIVCVEESSSGAVCTFRHALLRDAAYQSQLRSSRRDLHLAIATVLCEAFPDLADHQPELVAEHWAEAGQDLAAARWWYRAGLRMAEHAAHKEAVAHYRRALRAMHGISEDEGASQLEFELQQSLGCSLIALKGYTSAEAEQAHTRALELSARVKEQSDMTTRFGLWAYWVVRGDHHRGSLLATQAVDVAEASGREPDRAQAVAMLGYQEFYLGHFNRARALLEKGARWRFSHKDLELPHDPAVAALANLAPTLWILGRPEEARRCMVAARDRADAVGYPTGPYDRAYAHTWSAWFSQLTSEPEAAVEHAAVALEIAAEHGFQTIIGAATLHLAIAQATGPSRNSTSFIECGLEMWRDAGAELFVTYFLHWLAEARRLTGDVEGARAAVDEALHHVERRDERFHEAELLRLRGELALESAPGSAGDGIACLERAVQVARRQGAPTFERKALAVLHRALAARTGAPSR